jgi:predicted  nucleic acid-binding Zn-ribbon protein
MDTLAISRRLREAGLEQPAAEAITSAIRDAVDSHAASKADLDLLAERIERRIDTSISAVERRLDASASETDGRLNALDSKIDRATSALDSKIDRATSALDSKIDSATSTLNSKIDSATSALELKLTWWIIGAGGLFAFIQVAARYILPLP